MNLIELYVGDSLQFETSVPEYPASGGYTLKYRLVPRAGGSAYVITASASGDAYAVNVAAATTAAWVAGEYSWHAYIEISGARYTVGSGQLTLRPDPSAIAGGTDTRTQAEIALAQAKAAYASMSANPGRKSYTIGDVSVTFNSPAEILTTINYWETQVQREQHADAIRKGLKNPNRVYVRSLRG